MSEITAITPQVKDKTRCNIYLDGRFFCGITLEAAIKYRLKAGQSIDEKRLGEIQSESEKNVALDKALTYISATQKTEKDVRAYLRKKGYLPLVEDYAIEKMRSYGFIDDAAYAKNYAVAALKKKGKKLAAYELRAKGIDEESIENAFSAIEEERIAGEGIADEKTVALAVAEKFMRGKTTRNGDEEENEEERIKRKKAYGATLAALYRKLISRGVDGDIVKETVDLYRREEE